MAMLVLSWCWGPRSTGPWLRQGCAFPGKTGAPALPCCPPRRAATQGTGDPAGCRCLWVVGFGSSTAACQPQEMPLGGSGNSWSTTSPWGSPSHPIPSRASTHKSPVPAGLSVHQATLALEGPPTWTRLPRPPSAPSLITTCIPRSRYRPPPPSPSHCGWSPPHPLLPAAPTPCWTPRVTSTWTTPWTWRGMWRSCCGAPWTVSGSPTPSRDGWAPGPPPPAPALRGLCCVRVSVPGGAVGGPCPGDLLCAAPKRRLASGSLVFMPLYKWQRICRIVFLYVPFKRPSFGFPLLQAPAPEPPCSLPRGC